MGSDPSSCFQYFKVKGQADTELMAMGIPQLTICRPGAILQRDNDKRFGEKVIAWIPFIKKVKATQIAQAIHKVIQQRQQIDSTLILNN